MTALQARRDNIATSGNSVNVAHVFLDVRKKTLYCLNERARQLQNEQFPLTPADLDRQPLQTPQGQSVGPDDLPLVRAWKEGKSQEASFVRVRDGGNVEQIHWSAAPVREASGKLLGVSACVFVGPREPDWQLLAGLAHDLRSPLQALRLLVTVMEGSGPLTEAQRTVLDRVRTSAERAVAIGLDLLEWCRGPVRGGRKIDRGWIPLEPLLTSLADEVKGEAQRKALFLDARIDAVQGWEIHSDRVRLGRLLANLMNNAVRYTTSGRVLLSTEWREEHGDKKLVISVVDTGTGISPEEQDSIFNPFERGKAGRESDSTGSGLGLAVVDRLVEELALTLDVYSEYGRGSAFHLIVPLSMLRQTDAGLT
jgi:anti-sigma regulatory factor (Ser/Thr protein kinase)